MIRISLLRPLVLLAAFSLAIPLARAYPGLIDTTFGSSGLQSTPLTASAYVSSGTRATAMVRQPDGKLVVVGPTSTDDPGIVTSRFGIARYLSDGRLDATFGVQGRVTGGPSIGSAAAVLLDANERIVVVGTSFENASPIGPSRVAVARFLPDGSPDASFGVGGLATAALGETSAGLAGALDANGRIVVAGYSATLNRLVQTFLVTRFEANGALDTSFGQAGRLSFSMVSAAAEFGRSVAVDAQGRIVVAGSSPFGGGVARLLANGTLDASFGTGGKTTVAGTTSFQAVTIDTAGRVVLAGIASPSPGSMIAARLTDGGLPDGTFGTGGIALAGFPIAFPLMSAGYAVQVDAAGRVLVGGESGPSNPSTFSFARFLDNGTLDAAFGTAGRVTVTLVGASGSAAAGVRALAAGPGGTIYYAGHALGRFALGALDDNGQPLPSFNVTGNGLPVTTPVRFVSGSAASTWRGVAVQPDGKIVAAGSAVPFDATDSSLVAVTRRLAGGAPDPAFGGTGERVIAAAEGESQANAVAIDATGRVVVAGFAGPPGFTRFLLMRFLADGTRDSSFGVDGEVTTAFGAAEAIGNALAIDGSGRLVVGGSVNDGATRRLALARYLADGSPDTTFGTGGRATLAAGADATILAVTVDASGRIVAAGRNTATGESLLARFTAAGVPDIQFGLGGFIAITGLDARLNALAIDAQGRIVAVGGFQNGSVFSPQLVRVDTSLAANAGGLVVLGPVLAPAPSELKGVAIDDQGRLLVAGYSAGRFLVARFDPLSLMPDPTFGTSRGYTATGGSTGTNGDLPRAANAMALDPSGRAVLAGRDSDSAGRPVGLFARYASGSPADARTIDVYREGAGRIVSTPSGIDCGEVCRSELPAGTVVTLTATPAAGWRFGSWTGACSGTGSVCAVTLDNAATATATFAEGVALPSDSHFANLATRMPVLTGGDVLIGGFIIGGALPRTVVVRARGPSLAADGLPDLLTNPRIQLYAGQNEIASNDDWGTDASAAALSAAGLAPPAANESAILATLAPGGYTAVVSGVGAPGANTGNGIVEIFDTDPVDGRLVNIATRGRVGTGNDVMIAGLIIQGTQPQSVLIRARGPSLISAGVQNPLPNPQLQLFAGATQIAYNDNWQTSPDAALIQLTGFAPTNPAESVIRITLQPGAYTAIVTGAPSLFGVTGVAIVEVFAQ